MKQFILGVLLAISFSFACDSPYEEIQGVKIGCKFTNNKEFTKESGTSVGAGFYSKSKGVKFFDTMQVETDEDNNVIGIGFVKKYPITLSNMQLQEDQIISDYKMFAESLEKRWGAFDRSKAKGIFSKLNLKGSLLMRDIEEKTINKNPKSDAVGAIFILLSFKTDDKAMMQGKSQDATFIVGYFGKSTAEELQKEKESVTDGF